MPDRARLVGVNHVALEVGDVDAALGLYGRLFSFELRGRAGSMAFIDMGDQFLADDKDAVRAAAEREGLEIFPGRRLDFLDPWGNRFEIVDYRDIQFERVPGVKRKLGIEALEKRDAARQEIRERGLG